MNRHTPYIGPVPCLTLPEAARVADLLAAVPDEQPGDSILRAKCSAALTSDPAWRLPLRNA